MRFVRKIIADRMSAGVLALLLSFLMTLDGAIGAHALGAMAAAERVAAAQIICSTDTAALEQHGGHDLSAGSSGAGVHHKHGGKAERPECCSAACQFATQIAATDLPVVSAPQWPVPLRATPLARDYALVAAHAQGRLMAARGPPVFFS